MYDRESINMYITSIPSRVSMYSVAYLGLWTQIDCVEYTVADIPTSNSLNILPFGYLC